MNEGTSLLGSLQWFSDWTARDRMIIGIGAHCIKKLRAEKDSLRSSLELEQLETHKMHSKNRYRGNKLSLVMYAATRAVKNVCCNCLTGVT